MEIIKYLVSAEVALLFLGAILTLLLTIVVIYLRSDHKAKIERGKLEASQKIAPERVGDIDESLKNVGLGPFNFFEELTKISIRPLLMLICTYVFIQNTHTGIFPFIVVFFAFILVIAHEFKFADDFSSSWRYQIIVLFIWIITFLILSVKKNIDSPEEILKGGNTKANEVRKDSIR
jgi:hypothetical protein